MKNILITGASGFLGKNLLELIKNNNLNQKYNFLTPSSKELDLLNPYSVKLYFDNNYVDSIIHTAAICGGIGLNKKRPADLTHLNNKITVNIFDAIRDYKVKSLIGLGSVCSYPRLCRAPFKEDDLWEFGGKSEKTNHGYGESKKMLITEFQTHMDQYNLNGVILVSTNMFGAFDHFNDLENSHVIPALINKFINAVNTNLSEVYCWGDGSATRDFIISSDVCDAIITSLDDEISNYEPINIGSGFEISIKDLSNLIAKLTGFDKGIIFTGEVSDGQPRRVLSLERAKSVLNWSPKTSLEQGLIKTIDWYKENYL